MLNRSQAIAAGAAIRAAAGQGVERRSRLPGRDPLRISGAAKSDDGAILVGSLA